MRTRMIEDVVLDHLIKTGGAYAMGRAEATAAFDRLDKAIGRCREKAMKGSKPLISFTHKGLNPTIKRYLLDRSVGTRVA